MNHPSRDPPRVESQTCDFLPYRVAADGSLLSIRTSELRTITGGERQYP
jgi:hypothetical protein